MASAGAVMNYDFGQKRHWRKWIWNRIAERSDRNGLVVYMPGVNDFDREVAIAKGFRPNNLIGIERDGVALTRIRKNGALVASGDVFHAVDALAVGRGASVVFLDLCCGLSRQLVLKTHLWMQSPAFANTTFAFNILRGRDKETNGWRRWICSLPDKGWMSGDEKHRGAILGKLLAFASLQSVARCANESQLEIDAVLDDETLEVFVSHFQNNGCNTYMSTSGQVFDSLVFKNPYGMFDINIERAHMLGVYKDHSDYGGAKAKAARQSLAAVLAHRTMRAA